MIQLPTSPRARSATPRFINQSGFQRGSLGGADVPINRLGSRFAVSYQMPQMRETEASVWIARLLRGQSEPVRMYFPQMNAGGVPPDATAVTGGATMPAGSDLTAFGTRTNWPSSGLPEGKFFSLVANGVSYLHYLVAPVPLGTYSSFPIFPRFRAAIPASTPMQIGSPIIEGYVQGDEAEWTLDVARTVGLSFDIAEAQ